MDNLFDWIGNKPGKLLFRGSSKGLAAAVATLHAIERRGYSQQLARELWQEFGMPEVELFDFAYLSRFLER